LTGPKGLALMFFGKTLETNDCADAKPARLTQSKRRATGMQLQEVSCEQN